MSQQPVNVQIISDGEGTILVLEDSRVVITCNAEYSTPSELDEYLYNLKKRLTQYPWPDEDVDEDLPFFK